MLRNGYCEVRDEKLPEDATLVVEKTVSPGTIDKFVRPVIEANDFVIRKNIYLWDKILGKVIFDCHIICPMVGVIHVKIVFNQSFCLVRI